MKKIFLTLCLVLLLCSCSYAAGSDDIYVRKDVFDAKMEAQFNKLHGEIAELHGEIKALIARIDGNFTTLSGRIDGNFATLSGRIDGLEKRMDTTNLFLYYLLVLIGAILLLPFFNKWWEAREHKKQAAQPAFTLDDVKRLIAEAKFGAASQA